MLPILLSDVCRKYQSTCEEHGPKLQSCVLAAALATRGLIACAAKANTSPPGAMNLGGPCPTPKHPMIRVAETQKYIVSLAREYPDRPNTCCIPKLGDNGKEQIEQVA